MVSVLLWMDYIDDYDFNPWKYASPLFMEIEFALYLNLSEINFFMDFFSVDFPSTSIDFIRGRILFSDEGDASSHSCSRNKMMHEDQLMHRNLAFGR